MDVGRLLCTIGIHDWGAAKDDVTRGTAYSEVCSRCRKLR